MAPTHLLARDHLEQAAIILQDGDRKSRQLCHIIERTIALIDEFRAREREEAANVINFCEQKRARAMRAEAVWR
jgi:hypothetical protein